MGRDKQCQNTDLSTDTLRLRLRKTKQITSHTFVRLFDQVCRGIHSQLLMDGEVIDVVREIKL